MEADSNKYFVFDSVYSNMFGRLQQLEQTATTLDEKSNPSKFF
jgi:hypothetical protein